MVNYVLTYPIEFDGEKVTEINMNLEGLSTAALESAERQARLLLAKKESMAIPETNKKYLSCVAAKAAGVKLDLIRALNGKDYTQVCLEVQNFLLDGDSDSLDETEKKSDFMIPASSEMSKSTAMATTTKDASTVCPADLED